MDGPLFCVRSDGWGIREFFQFTETYPSNEYIGVGTQNMLSSYDTYDYWTDEYRF